MIIEAECLHQKVTLQVTFISKTKVITVKKVIIIKLKKKNYKIN